MTILSTISFSARMFKASRPKPTQMPFATLIKLFLFSLLSIALTGCSNPNYDIILPEIGADYIGEIPEEFVVEFAVPPTSITLNGVEVIEYFEFDETSAWAEGSRLEAYFNQGLNNLSVEPGEHGPRRYFDVDTQGPRVVITEVTGTDLITVHGELVDPSDIIQLSVNNTAAWVNDDDTFEVTLLPDQVYEFIAEDEFGHTSTTEYADRNMIVSDLLKLRIHEGAITDLLTFIQSIIESLDFNDFLGTDGSISIVDESIGITLPKTTIIPEICIPVIGCTPELALGPFDITLLALDIEINSLELEGLDIDDFEFDTGTDPLQGYWEGLVFDATIDGLNFGVKVDTYVLGLSDAVEELLDFLGLKDSLSALTGDFSVDLSMPRLRFASSLELSASDGNVNAGIIDITAVGLGAFDSDFDLNINLPSAIENFGFGLGGLVFDAIEIGIEGARDLIVELFLENLVPLVVNLVIDPLVNEFQVRFAAAVNTGALFTALLGVDDIDIVNNDSMVVSLMGRMGTEATDLDLGDTDVGIDIGLPTIIEILDDYLADVSGIPETLGAAPDLAARALGFRYSSTAVPDPDDAEEMSVIVSSNAINQSILAIFEAGFLSPSVYILNDLKESGQYILIDKDQANTRIALNPLSPPEFSFRGSEESIAYINIDHFQIYYQVLNEDDQWETTSQLEFSADIPVRISIDSESGLQLALISPSVFLQANIGQFLTFGLDFPSELWLMRTAATKMVEALNSVLAEFTFPDDISLGSADSILLIQPGEVFSIGQPRNHFGFDASFDVQ